MSLYGVLQTGVSGMGAQSSKLGTVADNIANANTNGYKRAWVEFSTLVLDSGTSSYRSGGVTPNVRHGVSQQGGLLYTTSTTDLAIRGAGFLIVGDDSGRSYLTRAGSFVPDASGNLTNAAGFQLLGYNLQTDPAIVANRPAGLEPVNVSLATLEATPSTEGVFGANLPANAAIVAAADLPSANAATAQYTAKTSLVSYDNLGNEVYLDAYFSKTAAGTWEVAVFDRAQATAGGFPYAAGPLATQTLDFDATTGKLTAASASSISIPVPSGQTLDLDLSKMSQLGAPYTVLDAVVNGNAPSPVDRVEISEDGTVYAVFENGARLATYRIPLADVPSPDKLDVLAGNVYQANGQSGDITVGLPSAGGMGALASGALEQSTVDLATELTSMIEAQRGYTANSKVFQTGAELLDLVVNLKR